MLAKALQGKNCQQQQQGNCINVFNINSNQPQQSGGINFQTQNNVNNGGIQTAGQSGPGGVVAQA